MKKTANTLSQKDFDRLMEARKEIAEADAAVERDAIGPVGYPAFKVAMEHGVHGGFIWEKLKQDIFHSSILFKEDLELTIHEDYGCKSMPTDSERIWAESPIAIKEYYLRKAMGFHPGVVDHEESMPPGCMTLGGQKGCLNYRDCEWWAECVVSGYISALAAGWDWNLSEGEAI